MDIQFDSNNINLAWTEKSSNINPDLTEHSYKFEQGIYHLHDIFYLAVGYGVANSFMVRGNDSLIIIDTCENIETASQILKDFRKYTDLPISTIIYTHNHLDHIGGVKAYVNKEDVNAGKVKIYAHSTMMDGIRNMAANVGHILNRRSIYSFGLALKKGDDGHINDGIGPEIIIGTPTFIVPTDTFDSVLKLIVSGIRMELYYAPSETDNEIFIYFPDYELVQSADIIMGETYPNIHSIRGTKYRDPTKWWKAIDMIRELQPKYIFPSHGRPIEGKENVMDMLTAYRDAIQFTHDQTIRYMNEGYTPDELVEVLPSLPDNLKNHAWLGEFYGTVKHSVRQIYNGYLGWFIGDPTSLDPLPQRERALKYINTMGGRDNILKIGKESYDNKEYKWAAEILTYLINININDKEAKLLKAKCLKKLGYGCKNINWRNWYLSASQELDGTFDHEFVNNIDGINANDIMAEIPTRLLLNQLCVKLDTSRSNNIHRSYGFYVGDEYYVFNIRSCVVEFCENNNQLVDHTAKINDNIIKKILSNKTNILEQKHNIELGDNTTIYDIEQFFSYFDLEKKYPLLTHPHI